MEAFFVIIQNMAQYELVLSVHQLVDFLLRTGDIDNRVYNQDTMQEGTRLHSLYQHKQGRHYIAEYPLRGRFVYGPFDIILEGRADGVFFNGEEYTIDEIKSTVAPLEEYYLSQKEWHLGQAKCYALMFAHERNIDKINIQLTYLHQLDKSTLVKTFHFTINELEHDVNKMFKEYISFYTYILERTVKRNQSARHLRFPFVDFREGQREMSKYCYSVAENGGTLFVEAPTGIGKTISALYPSVKSFASEENEKIFYLTAKNSGKEMAFDTMTMLKEHGLEATPIAITAKEKICFNPGKSCNPDECPFAKDYYTNIKRVLIDSLKRYDTFNMETIQEIAGHYAICPFEFSLDLSLFCDVVICDYNYFFDPIVYLKRYFEEDASKKVVLVDEAHNLIERGRKMYSATLNYRLFKKVQHSLSGLEHKKMKNAVKRISKLFNEFKDLEDGDHRLPYLEQTHLNGMEAFLLAERDMSRLHHDYVTDELKDFMMELNKFFRLYDYFDDSFVLYVSKKGDKDITLNLYCLDPSSHLRMSFDKVKSRTIFSATLSPSQYYIESVGGTKKDPFLQLPSPFDPSHLKLMVAPTISVRYKKRSETLLEVVDYIKTLLKSKIGNYFIYVPSYEYLHAIAPLLEDESYDLMLQNKEMTDQDKQNLLDAFEEHPTRTKVGLAVVGGAFGEGIDLVSERLIGVVVVGTGIPQICYERNLIRDYYDKENGLGYLFAYLYPGMNKVMQAVGRVIRGENDRGVALLIDDRYLTKPYRDLFRSEWNGYTVVTSKKDVQQECENFWKNNK